jgi:hypothetical protein
VKPKEQNSPWRVLSPIVLTVSILCGGCSMDRMVARSTVSIMDGGREAMFQESDLQIAEAAMPSNLKLVEGLIFEDPGNLTLHEYAAEGLYGYSFGFVEDENPERASDLYARCFDHALQGLKIEGLEVDVLAVSEPELEAQLSQLERSAVPSLSWAASCWAKFIDMNRNDPASIANLSRAAALMNRVLELDEDYFHGSPHIFFGVYYGSRAPMFGGDYAKAEYHFDKARRLSGGDNFLVDVLQAQTLDRQKFDRKAFNERLTRVVDGNAAKNPALTLQNRISQQKAKALLAKEEEWF